LGIFYGVSNYRPNMNVTISTALRAGNWDAGAVPAAARDVDLGAERQPDIAGGNSRGEGLIGRSTAERGEHKVAAENACVRLTEFFLHCRAKFA
jgi:hypothetical protein